MKLVAIVLGMLCFHANSLLAQASLYTMTIEDVPAANSAECQRVASSISSRLVQLSSVEIYGEQCSAGGLSSGVFNIGISYYGDAPVPDVVADDRSYAAYDSLRDCQADLSFQRQLLEDETGLPVLYAFCSREGLLKMRVIGVSTVQRYLFAAMVDEMPAFAQIYTPNALSGALAQALVREGIHVSRITFSQSSLDLYYYASEELPFGFAHEPRYETAELCQQRAADFKSIVEPNVTVLFQFCAETDGLGDAARTLYTFGFQPGAVVPSIFGDLDLNLLPTPPDRFTSRQDCESQIDRILEAYRTRLDLPARAAVCSLRWLDYGRTLEVLVFE